MFYSPFSWREIREFHCCVGRGGVGKRVGVRTIAVLGYDDCAVLQKWFLSGKLVQAFFVLPLP